MKSLIFLEGTAGFSSLVFSKGSKNVGSKIQMVLKWQFFPKNYKNCQAPEVFAPGPSPPPVKCTSIAQHAV